MSVGAWRPRTSGDKHALGGTDRRRALMLLSVAATAVLAGCSAFQQEPSATTSQATATVVFDFAGARTEGAQQVEAEVTFDPGARPTMSLYEETGAERPDVYTVHDLLAEHNERSSVAIEIEHREHLGYLLSRVDGYPGESSQAFWSLHVDGDRETASLGTLPVEDGSTYTWRLVEESPEGGRGEARAGAAEATTEQARWIVEFNGSRAEDPQRTEHVVTYNPGSRPTMPRYEETEVPRPDAYVLHDLLSDWANQTDTAYEVELDEDLGYRLVSIGGVPANGSGGQAWRLSIDGETETASLNAITVEPDRTYRWLVNPSEEG